MLANDRGITAGLISPRDLDVVRQGFSRHFAIDRSSVFPELLQRLDSIEEVKPGKTDPLSTSR